MSKEKKEKKKGNRKRTLLIILGVIIVLGFFGSSSKNEAKEDSTGAKAADAQQTEDSQQEDSTDNSIIELIAGEQGQYGKLITMSEGTDMEESFYVYYIPGGTYEVTNDGEYMTQISVYESFSKNKETGYDEYTNTGDILALDVGKTDTIEIPDGWFIEIQEPTHISLILSEKESDNTFIDVSDLLTCPTFTAEKNSSAMVDQIAFTAKEYASTLSDEQANEIINIIREADHKFYNGPEEMEKFMWYGYLLDYKYDDSDPRSELGTDLCQAIKYVYRNVETVLDDATHENLLQIDKSLEQIQ